jgi:hypothetical protein
MNKRTWPLLGLCPMGKFVFNHEDALVGCCKYVEGLEPVRLNEE